ncbi:neutral zinc metallopeptidase [Streptosporangium carneum]|uniref:Peptidase n=1 Tax=Streptosporangium carneum TaxID=47481 RepID=A0A9W6HXD4_9ACTN|nr:neutral zinc metallopeptidase [Streptosporangium carneum]GLK08145.1 peptidase [Streptosporangium carneum]
MENPRDRTRDERPRFGGVRRTLAYLCAFALVGGAIYFGGRFEELTGSTPGPLARAAATPGASVPPAATPGASVPPTVTPGVPALPTATPSQPVWLRVTHRSYRGLGPVDARCDSLPGTMETEKTLRALALCLDRMWAATLAQVDVAYTRPELRLVRTPEEAACALNAYEWGGLYCFGTNVVNVRLGEDIRPMFVLAHEYAHHAQFVGAIADGLMTRRHDEDWSRRLELQASCLAAVTLRTALPGELDLHRRMFEEYAKMPADDWVKGYVRTHGSWAHTVAWMKRGEREGTVASCDTWGVHAKRVS